MDLLRLELRQAARSLRRRPGFTLLAALTLALGIGANTAIFSVVYDVLLRPLPFPDADRLVQVWELDRRGEHAVAPANYLDWRAESRSFASLAAYDLRSGNLIGADQPRRIQYSTVSANFFSTLGGGVLIGRAFREDDPHEPNARSAILSHGLWRDDYGADPGVLGRTIRLDEQSFTVVGVAAPSFAFPEGTELYVRAPYDVPELRGMGPEITRMRDAWYFRVVGRLAAGSDLAAARVEMLAIAERLAAAHPLTNAEARTALVPLREQMVGAVRPRLLLLLGAVTLVLLVACANVANLVLVRAAGRRHEMAVRQALGAARRRLLATLLSESLLLAALGGSAGLAVAWTGVRLLRAAPAGALPGASATLSAPVLVFGALLSFLSMTLFGSVPAFLASRRVALRGALGERASGATAAARRARSGFVAVEVALAVVLVLGAGLLLRSLGRIQAVDPGFAPEGLTALRISVPGARAMEPASLRGLYGEVLERVGALPGVGSAAFATSGPLDDGPGAGLRIEGRPVPEDALPDNGWQQVSPGYFGTARIPLLSGRSLAPPDDGGAEPVAVINQAMARLRWPDADPIGARINTGLDGRGIWVRVVGVVGDTRNASLTGPTTPEMYRPLAQGSRAPGESLLLLVRSPMPSEVVVAQVQRAIWSVRSDLPVYDVATGHEMLGALAVEPRVVLGLLASFALLALTLGAIGIYGVTAHSVRQRRREIGIRIAIGARPAAIVRMVLAHGLVPVAIGLAGGLGMAVLGAGALEGLLFEVSATDPLVFGSVPLMLLGVAIAAMLVPAVRAAAVHPAVTLREEG